ncbi:MAG: hypothetical protein HOD67_03370, partial [Euryarchaeota archaeon]|nr:hypothetical protein [Euryarchaeota archaeon]
MKILGIHIPFTEFGLRQQWNHHTGEWENYPLFWFNDPEHIIINAQQSKISLHDGQKKSSSEVIFTQIFDLVLLVVGFLFIMAPIVAILGDVVPAYLDEESDEPCWPDQENAITLSDGDIFCEWGQRSETYSDYQIADNHYQISVTSQTGGNVGITEYRWSEDNGIITSASIWQDEFGIMYECQQYIRASSLPDNWTGNDLFIHYEEEHYYPAWCNDEPSQDEQEYTETNTIPFEGELLYHLDVSERLYGIYTTQFTENDKVNYTNHELFHPYPHFEPIMLIFILVFGGVGVAILSFIDRKRVLIIDGANNQVKFEYVKWPRYDTISYELQSPISYEIRKKKRTKTHSNEEGERTTFWTTTHHGVDVAFDLVGEGPSPLLFLEGNNPQTEFESILELL